MNRSHYYLNCGNLGRSPEGLDCRFFSATEVAHFPLAGVSGRQEMADWLASKMNGHNHG